MSSLEAQVERATQRACDLYFDALLPRYLEAYYRGAGYGLVAQLLEDHDVHAVRRVLERPEPGALAKELARGAQEQVPVYVRYLPADVVPARYGEFLRTDHFESMMGVDYRELGSEFQVVLYWNVFAGIDPQHLEDEVLFTLFHEMVHYFESFLPASERPLAERERGVRVRMSLTQAWWWDTWYMVRWWVFWSAVGVVTVGMAGAIAWTMG